tara:strand:- start:2421 stop:3875 length:1455 start_codon:yes stop_codon:yes gene_type:complete
MNAKIKKTSKNNLQSVPYRLHPKMHPMIREVMEQKDFIFYLMKKYGSPLNLIFPQIFREKYELFDQMLRGEHLNYRLYYTCKPNRSNALLREAAELGAYVDVSSHGEFQAALQVGIEPEKISATGPKNKVYMDIIIENQSMCVIDNWHELEYISTYARLGQPVMVRLSKPLINSAVSDDTFGLPYNELNQIIQTIKNTATLDFYGFAVHYNYRTEINVAHIETVVSATLQAFEGGLSPKAVNIGGGYLVRYVDCKDDWNDFINHIKGSLKGNNEPVTWDGNGMGFRLQNGTVIGTEGFMNHCEPVTCENHLEKVLYSTLECLDGTSLLDFIRDSGLEIYVEPGRALMDQCGVTLANVEFTKKSSKGNLLVNLDMHYANLNAHTFKYMAEPVLIHRNDNLPPNQEGVYYYGSLCFASDLITFHKTFPDYLPENGDIAAFINTAAYRMDFTESEMLRHPNAVKICITQNDNQWMEITDNDYKKDQS